jgi:lysophospholipase L1-like esterase
MDNLPTWKLGVMGLILVGNLLCLGLGGWAIARLGGWNYLCDRLMGNPQPDSTLHGQPYYIHRRSQLERLAIAPVDTVFLGDSLTNEGEWSDWFPDLKVRNRGISSDTTTGILRRLEPILKGQPQRIFLMIGINDLVVQQKSPERVLAHYEQILKTFRERSPQTQVVVQSVLPVVMIPNAVHLNRKIQHLNIHLQDLAQQFGHPYIDLHSQFLHEGELDRACTTDGVHLNGEGYARWAAGLALITED